MYKKALFVLILCSVYSLIIAQEDYPKFEKHPHQESLQNLLKGVEFSTAINVEDATDNDIEKLQYIEKGKFFIYPFKYNIIGVAHSKKRLLDILEKNDANFNKPTYNEDIIPSYVENYIDYEHIFKACSVGDGEIFRRYVINLWMVDWVINDDYILLGIRPVL